ncbi:MAG: DUF4265 domain-containing protein [Planctomycetes bacterium]|nr:DUF4265 domain-containing protein [Planctomycetota bacterium]MCB9879013.1 DUF4265 domain-containing protein [Planctomycetota bacterium]
MADSELCKIVLVTGQGDNVIVETPWAEHVEGDQFRLRNIPFYAYGVSLDDVIEATPEPDDSRPHFRRVVVKSGNRTLRVAAAKDQDRVSQDLLDELAALGCDYCRATPRYVCITIAPAVPLDAVVAVLERSEFDWEQADPSDEELSPE